MKRVAAVVLLVVFVFNCAPTLPQYKYDSAEREEAIIISERVGETVDTEEGEQFGLFTEIEEFKEAKFFAIGDGGYIIEIVADGDKLVAINRDQDAVAILRDYLGGYKEASFNRLAFESKWGILDYDTLGIPITEDEANYAIKQSKGRAVTRFLTCCGGSSLIGLAAAVAIGAPAAGGDPSVTQVAVGVGALILAVGVLVGLVTGYAAYKSTYSKDPDTVLKAIKEARKPRIVE